MPCLKPIWIKLFLGFFLDLGLESCFSLLAYALKFLKLEKEAKGVEESILRFEMSFSLIPKAAANEGELALA
jgi:hypothetical protein